MPTIVVTCVIGCIVYLMFDRWCEHKEKLAKIEKGSDDE